MGTFGINGCDGSILAGALAKGCLWGLESWVGRKRGRSRVSGLCTWASPILFFKKIVIGNFIFLIFIYCLHHVLIASCRLFVVVPGLSSCVAWVPDAWA